MRFSSNNKQDNYTMRSISSQGKKQPKAKSFELRNTFLQLSDDPHAQKHRTQHHPYDEKDAHNPQQEAYVHPYE